MTVPASSERKIGEPDRRFPYLTCKHSDTSARLTNRQIRNGMPCHAARPPSSYSAPAAIAIAANGRW
jgi:hypothetical protein